MKHVFAESTVEVRIYGNLQRCFNEAVRTLIQLQQEASDAILALGENGKRAMGYGVSFMNKKGRGLRAIRQRYVGEVMALGFSEEQAREQWGDIKDYTSLCALSDE